MSSRNDLIEMLRKPRATPSRRATKIMLVIALIASAVAVALYPREVVSRDSSPFTTAPLPNATDR